MKNKPIMQFGFPGAHIIKNPGVDLRYKIEIDAPPAEIWPWIQQMGYHRGGWYIDTWWDKFAQQYFWPAVVPKEARGTFKPPANEILAEYQNITVGDIIPDGPRGSAFYEVMEVKVNSLLLLYATSHFKYMAPQFVYKTRFAPNGAFCWAFIIREIEGHRSTLISWWQAEVYPRSALFFFKPFLVLVDSVHQKAILRGVKKRVESLQARNPLTES